MLPEGLIIRGLRQEPGNRASPIFGGTWIYIVTAFALTAAQTGLEPSGPSTGMLDAVAGLFGFGEDPVRESGWLWAARILFVICVVVMPVIGTILAPEPR